MKSISKTSLIIFLVVSLFLVLSLSSFAIGITTIAEAAEAGAFEGIKIRFFTGGAEGCPFGTIVYNGALEAQKYLGVQVEYIFSGWDNEKMISQLRDAVAARPDGIAMMGHPGNDAIMPLAEQAFEDGILMTYQNVDVPEVRAKYGGGYVGADLVSQGRALGEEAIKLFDLKAGDGAVVYGNWEMPGRYIREEATAIAFEDAGLKVRKISVPTPAISDTELLLPVFTADLLANPDTKAIVFANSTSLGASQVYLDAAGVKPGDVKIIGFDNSPAIMDAFSKGYVHLSSDQQPYLQGFIPILSLVLTKAYGLSAISLDTGKGFITAENYKDVGALVEIGLR